MIDLLQATEFIKMPNGNYLNKLSNGKEYSEAELKELLKDAELKIDKDLDKDALVNLAFNEYKMTIKKD